MFLFILCYNDKSGASAAVGADRIEIRKRTDERTRRREERGFIMISVVKRDGEVAEFNLSKITEAIKKAFKATEKEFNNEILELLALRVTADFQSKMKDGKITVEQIQDSVEHVLEQAGYTDVAKAYILYRKQREKIRNMKNTILDYRDVVNSYVKVEDWRVKENSTEGM